MEYSLLLKHSLKLLSLFCISGSLFHAECPSLKTLQADVSPSQPCALRRLGVH